MVRLRHNRDLRILCVTRSRRPIPHTSLDTAVNRDTPGSGFLICLPWILNKCSCPWNPLPAQDYPDCQDVTLRRCTSSRDEGAAIRSSCGGSLTVPFVMTRRLLHSADNLLPTRLFGGLRHLADIVEWGSRVTNIKTCLSSRLCGRMDRHIMRTAL